MDEAAQVGDSVCADGRSEQHGACFGTERISTVLASRATRQDGSQSEYENGEQGSNETAAFTRHDHVGEMLKQMNGSALQQPTPSWSVSHLGMKIVTSLGDAVFSKGSRRVEVMRAQKRTRQRRKLQSAGKDGDQKEKIGHVRSAEGSSHEEATGYGETLGKSVRGGDRLRRDTSLIRSTSLPWALVHECVPRSAPLKTRDVQVAALRYGTARKQATSR